MRSQVEPTFYMITYPSVLRSPSVFRVWVAIPSEYMALSQTFSVTSHVKNMILQAKYLFLPLWYFFLLFYHLFVCFFIFLGWTNSSRDSQGLISRPKKNYIQMHQHSEQNIKVIKWKSPKKVAKLGSKRLFLENLEQTPKMRWKKFARVSPRPIGPKENKKHVFAGNVFVSSSLVVFSVVLSCFLLFYFLGVDKFKSRLAGFNFKTKKELHPNSSAQRAKYQSDKMEITKKSCKVRLINVCFLKIWSKLQKCAEKNRESFP